MTSFEQAVTKTIRREGGDKITDDPADPGGLTKYGIARRSHPDVDIRRLTLQGAKDIYHREYWIPVHGDALTSQLKAELIFDAAVNMGVAQAIKLAQLAVDAEADGDLGPVSFSAIEAADEHDFAASFTLAKIARYVYLVKKNRALDKFLLGWLIRSLEVGS